VSGIATVINATEPNRLSVDFSQSRMFSFKGSYDVWATDYHKYSLVYSCRSFLGFLKFEMAWILSRNKQLDAGVVEKLKDLLNSNGVDASKFDKTAQVCDN
jgi:lipocalin